MSALCFGVTYGWACAGRRGKDGEEATQQGKSIQADLLAPSLDRRHKKVFCVLCILVWVGAPPPPKEWRGKEQEQEQEQEQE